MKVSDASMVILFKRGTAPRYHSALAFPLAALDHIRTFSHGVLADLKRL
jgi:hypothetical protein